LTVISAREDELKGKNFSEVFSDGDTDELQFSIALLNLLTSVN
jgi:hypothetical protein